MTTTRQPHAGFASLTQPELHACPGQFKDQLRLALHLDQARTLAVCRA